jgi:NAD-dependent DNA ligase
MLKADLQLPSGKQMVFDNGTYFLIYTVGTQPKWINREMFTNIVKEQSFPPLIRLVDGKLEFLHLYVDGFSGSVKWRIGTLEEGKTFEEIKWVINEKNFPVNDKILFNAAIIWSEFLKNFKIMFPSDEAASNQILKMVPKQEVESPPNSDREEFLTPNGMTYYDFLQHGDQKEIEKWFDVLDDAYYNKTALLENEIYDDLVKIYESRFGTRTKIRTNPTRDPARYKIVMMSLNKVKEEKELKLFLAKNPGPWVIQEKIDGNSSQYANNFLAYAGNGVYGNDISYMIPALNLPKIPDGLAIKGELVINKKDYEPFKKEYKTNLSMVSGLLNERTTDPNMLKMIKFIAYDVSANVSISQSLTMLKQAGFQVPEWTKVDTLSIEWLSQWFNQRKEQASYAIDGLVIIPDRVVTMEERVVIDHDFSKEEIANLKNPAYACAFKEYSKKVVATVVDVHWKASKHGSLKPRAEIQPIPFGNFTLTFFTGFNAGFIDKYKVGPGAQLLITHNTVPHILSVIQGTEAKLPPNPETWKWNSTHVDLILLEENDEMRISRIYEFFRQIGAKYVGETTLAKFYYKGFTTVKSILEAGRDGLLRAKVEGIGEKMVTKMTTNIHNALCTVTLSRLMSASCVFGHGFGVRKIDPILERYPNILNENITVSQIVAIPGYADITATKFVEGLPKFRAWLLDIPVLIQYFQYSYQQKAIKLQEKQQARNNNANNNNNNYESVQGKSFVFTGTRNKELEEEIAARGGSVKTSVSRNTNFVINGGGKGENSGKSKDAAKHGVPVLTFDEFHARFGF